MDKRSMDNIILTNTTNLNHPSLDQKKAERRKPGENLSLSRVSRLGREEAMQAQRKNRNEMEDPILRQPTLK